MTSFQFSVCRALLIEFRLLDKNFVLFSFARLMRSSPSTSRVVD